MPVLMMMDECVGHMTEKVVIPPADADRDRPAPAARRSRPASTCPTAPTTDLVPEMVRAGDGYRFHTTGLTHDERGYPAMTIETPAGPGAAPGGQDPEERGPDHPRRGGADRRRRRRGGVATASPRASRSWASSWRAQQGVEGGHAAAGRVLALPGDAHPRAGRRGSRPSWSRRSTSGRCHCEVERCAAGQAATIGVPHAGGGVHDPEAICQAILGGGTMSTPIETRT